MRISGGVCLGSYSWNKNKEGFFNPSSSTNSQPDIHAVEGRPKKPSEGAETLRDVCVPVSPSGSAPAQLLRRCRAAARGEEVLGRPPAPVNTAHQPDVKQPMTLLSDT